MAFKEIIFERLALALEATRGTAIADPTHVMNGRGMLTATAVNDEQAESRGEKWAYYTSERVREGAVFSTPDAAVDPNLFTLWLNMAVAPVTSASQPDATNWPNTYLWQFVPTAASDDVKTATVWWGEAQVQYFKSDYGIVNSLSFSNDSNQTQGARFSVDGMAGFPEQVAAPTLPANIGGRYLRNMVNAQVWMDAVSAIGTTAVTGRVIAATHRITTGLFPKFLAAGPLAAMDYTDVGIEDTGIRLVTTITLEVPNTTEYDLFEENTVLKTRVRHNGPVIDVYGGGVDSFRYVEFDNYGPLKNPQWGTNRGNRTITFTIESLKDSTLGAPFRVAVQSPRSAL